MHFQLFSQRLPNYCTCEICVRISSMPGVSKMTEVTLLRLPQLCSHRVKDALVRFARYSRITSQESLEMMLLLDDASFVPPLCASLIIECTLSIYH